MRISITREEKLGLYLRLKMPIHSAWIIYTIIQLIYKTFGAMK